MAMNFDATSAINFAVEEMRNVKKLEENMKVLTRKIELLNSREVDVLTSLQGAELSSRRKRKREVENWLKNVDEKRRQFERLGQEIGQTRSINIVARLRLAKQIVQEIDEVVELVEQGIFPEGIVLDVVVKESVPLVTFKVKGVAFEQNLENIWVWLMDDDILSIGIYGMGGVGKTTLALHLHDNLLREPEFTNCVYWVTVSQESNNFKLQNDIAKAMSIDISSEDDETRRAAKLFQTLSKRKKFVLILDDVWNQFDVKKIGLPFRRDGFKLLVTSRFADICQRIGCQKLIKVEALSQSEAWELFWEELGHETVLAPSIENTAKKVAQKCAGLPLGIITMARSLRGVTDIYGWEDALEELNESCMAQDSMKSDVLPILLYSFNRLRNQKLKNCFLYCSLYPEDREIHVDELINMFIIEELMDRRSRRQAEFNQGHAILTELEKSCLLITSKDDEGNECVKMHDLVREMAIWITRDNPRFMVKTGHQLKEIPTERDWKEDLNKVYLMLNDIGEIPAGTSPKCPNLSTLILRENPISVIPDSFFVQFRDLKILDLSMTNIVQLPNSISDLENLKALLVSGCESLISIPSLEKLKELRELNLSYTNIMEVIHGMENLTNLKCLNLDGISLEMIPSGTLQKLSDLQRLILPLGVAVAVEEVEGLRHLEEFKGIFCSISDFNRFMKSQHCHGQPTFYDIGIGNEFFGHPFADTRLTRKMITLTKCGSLKEIGNGDEIMLPRDIEALSIESCEEMECIMRFSSDEELMHERRWHILENLKNLYLDELPNFMGIIKWEPGVAGIFRPSGTLSNLRELEIFNCESIKRFLPRDLVDNLKNLEELKVTSCDQMEEIIGEDEGIQQYHKNNVTLPRLKHLILRYLPALKSISVSTIICNSIETITIAECKKIKKIPLFHGRSAPPALKNIIILETERGWWNLLEWDHFEISNAIQPFLKLK